ncbi:MAG: zf-HC2 domain-containing protein [Bryobacterales bacterium]|nr:zf-HC2 domain-containing protein [Bryobacterales bacterium]MBV9398663.1 zf-HC2 domain-containing protein [Bryobacterales bacterium]
MITCDEFMAELGNYLEGEVANEVRKELERHLSHCRTCQVVYDSTLKTVKIVTDSGSFDLPEVAALPIREKIMSRIRKETTS